LGRSLGARREEPVSAEGFLSTLAEESLSNESRSKSDEASSRRPPREQDAAFNELKSESMELEREGSSEPSEMRRRCSFFTEISELSESEGQRDMDARMDDRLLRGGGVGGLKQGDSERAWGDGGRGSNSLKFVVSPRTRKYASRSGGVTLSRFAKASSTTGRVPKSGSVSAR